MLQTVDRRWVMAGGAVALLVIAGLLFALLSGSDDGGTPADGAVSATSTAGPTGTAASGGGSAQRPDDVEASLTGLGVDTTASDRVAPDSEPLPDNYSPLGSSPSFGDRAAGSGESSLNKTDELFLVGIEVAGTGSVLSLIEQNGVQIDGGGTINPGTTSVLNAFDLEDNGWATTPGARSGDSDDTRQLRAVAAGDVDRATASRKW